ncbi:MULTISPECIES: DeoR/GlpR family DNA-binding transcription regulator [Lactobacillus]|uniref:DeoR/GlpR transcriptional regulator n=1 Tax=Lactobacillus xujianguonis TaxID=2495899 RepID=A0A437SWN2_9LACO|nr:MULTISPECIES: DeoR/GlpR family DNA-binding transcription regulator [Lactobacillus]RVU71336.1 DeoR/GlpR transcriptional regulator [Lactobacillus xujianguonis]RVU74039.1 DeoR/GlpR transcriptional regulator [Lactobacillus xujianguonis]
MNQEERLIMIKKMLTKQQQLSTRDLANHFHVSFDTARRDVLRLTSTGQAVRIHGGLMAIDQNDVPSFLMRNQIQSPLKEKMAHKAKRFIHPGQCDFIGPSTTLRHLCTQLGGNDLQIVTNSIDNALALMAEPLPSVILLGGEIRKKERYIFSASSLNELNRFYFNTAFVGASKVRNDGIYTPSLQDAEMIEAAVNHAKQVVLIAENYKFTNHNSSPYRSASLDQIDVVITDMPLAPERRQIFKKQTQIISVMKGDHYA